MSTVLAEYFLSDIVAIRPPVHHQNSSVCFAPNVLSARLKLLAEQALIVSRPYSERPPRFVYELTESGRELAGALRLLADWGARTAGDAEPLRHAVCGSTLEARWWCPDCEQVVDDAADDGDVIHV